MKETRYTTRSYMLKDDDKITIENLVTGALHDDEATQEYLSKAFEEHYNNYGTPSVFDITEKVYDDLLKNIEELIKDNETNASQLVKQLSKYINKSMVLEHVKHLDREVYVHLYRFN